MSVPDRSVVLMEQKWIGIGIGHGGREAERALNDEGFKCTRQSTFTRSDRIEGSRQDPDSTDREEVERTLRRVNGRDAWI